MPDRLRISPRCSTSVTCRLSSRYSDSSAGWLNRPNPSAQNADEHGADRADPLDAGEGGLHRDRRRLRVLDQLAEHVLLLELPAGWFLHEEREDRDDDHRDPEDEPCPAPALDTAGPGSRSPRPQTGLQSADAVRAHVDHGRHPGADADRVVVGDQRLVHRDAVRLGDPGGEPGPEQHERARRQARAEHEEPEREARPADDRHPLVAVGEPAHRDRAEHEERRRCRRDEHDRALADPERLADLRARAR